MQRGEIGQGPRSSVYRGYQRSLGRPVVLKVLRRYDEASKEKFHREATITAGLKHHGIRKVIDAQRIRHEGRRLWFIVMEYVDRSLREMIGRPLDVVEAARIGAEIAEVLHYVHQQGLVHLDVKPSNILIFEDGHAVLSDFGIARPIDARTTDGTPQYMSPEQVRNAPVQPASDVYSLGVVLYEMLTGRPPYRASNDLALMRKHADPNSKPEPPRKSNPRIPAHVEEIVLKALTKNPEKRYTTAAEIEQDLRRVAEGRTGGNVTTGITTLIEWVEKQPLLPVITVAIIPVFVFLMWSLTRPPSQPGGPASQTPLPTTAITDPPTDTKAPVSATEEPATKRTEGPTATLKPAPTETVVSTTPAPEIATPVAPDTLSIETLCPNSDVRITSPAPDEVVTVDIPIEGTANWAPGEVQYFKVEWRGGSRPNWTTMGDVHTSPVLDGQLEMWYAGGLEPGTYDLRLVLVGQDAEEKATCMIPVEVK